MIYLTAGQFYKTSKWLAHETVTISITLASLLNKFSEHDGVIQSCDFKNKSRLKRIFSDIISNMFKTNSLTITPQILALIARIDEFKGAWRTMWMIAPDRLSALRRVATIESVGSSTRIEGSKLSNQEVEKLLAKLEIKTFETRDEQEVAGYAELMETIFSAWEYIPVNENHIKQLHRDLLAHSNKDEFHRGQYKTLANRVAAFDEQGNEVAVIFETASPFDTPQLMTELIEWYRLQILDKTMHPLIVVAIWTVVFLEIHPFQDGNGRLSRVLTTLLLLKSGYTYVPYSSLESVIEENKEAYYMALRQTQGTIRSDAPDWQPWLLFFLQSLDKQVMRLEKKIEYEQMVLTSLPQLALNVVELVKERGRISLSEAVVLTGGNPNTLKKHLQHLTITGILQRHGAGRGVWYSLA